MKKVKKMNVKEKIKKFKDDMKKLKEKSKEDDYLQVVLEDCSSFKIPYKNIRICIIDGIKEKIRIRESKERNIKSCELFFIIIEGDWLEKEYSHFGIYRSGESNRYMLRMSDITSVSSVKKGVEGESIYVKWEGNKEEINDAQHSGVLKDGKGIWIAIYSKDVDKDRKKYLKKLIKSWDWK